MGLLDDLPRGVRERKSLRKQSAPLSAFVDPARLGASDTFAYGPSKVFLGAVGGAVRDDGREFYVSGGQALGIGDDRHVVLCAGSRAGKGRSTLIPTLLGYAGSMLVLDPKGELAGVTARHRAEAGQKVCIVDPFEICAQRLAPLRAGFNPMSLLEADSPTLVVDAGLIADAIVMRSENERDPHWDESARTFIEGLILHVATWEGHAGRRSLVTVRDLLTHGAVFVHDGEESTSLEGLRREMAANAAVLLADSELENDPSERQRLSQLSWLVEGAAADFFEKPDREQGSVLSTARRHTKFLDYAQLRDSLAPDPAEEQFALTDLKTAPHGLTVYLCLPAGRMATCNRWFRLFVNLALEAMEREKAKPEIPVLAVLEEFHVLGYMQQVETAAALVAGFGMKLLIVLQDLTQLKRHYKDGWETFLGNAGCCVFFGNSDTTTLKYVSERCGQTSLIVERGSEVTQQQRESGATGSSWSMEVRELLTPEEVCRFFGRDDHEQRQLILRPGMSPAVMQRIKYDKHELFRGQFDEPE
ncbi:MAG: type IV secretory system conjugative DNA transfer family protein [Alphaproteobacteria bacterium]